MQKEKTLKLYLGGSLFTESEREQRTKEYNLLEKAIGDKVEIYSPMHNDEINDKSKEVNSVDIFLQDTEKVLESDYFYCNIEEIETDPGLAVELGIILANNILLTTLEAITLKLIERGADKKSLEMLLNTLYETCPIKNIFVNMTDIRLLHDNPLVGMFKDKGLNQFVIGGLLDSGAIVSNGSEETVEKIKQNVKDSISWMNYAKELEEKGEEDDEAF